MYTQYLFTLLLSLLLLIFRTICIFSYDVLDLLHILCQSFVNETLYFWLLLLLLLLILGEMVFLDDYLENIYDQPVKISIILMLGH